MTTKQVRIPLVPTTVSGVNPPAVPVTYTVGVTAPGAESPSSNDYPASDVQSDSDGQFLLASIDVSGNGDYLITVQGKASNGTNTGPQGSTTYSYVADVVRLWPGNPVVL